MSAYIQAHFVLHSNMSNGHAGTATNKWVPGYCVYTDVYTDVPVRSNLVGPPIGSLLLDMFDAF